MPSLYLREKNPSNGNWRYERVKTGKGIKTGDLVGPFFVRPFVKGKQIWSRLSATTFKDAEAEADHIGVALEAASRGLSVAEAEAIANSDRVPIRTAVQTYLEQKRGKARKTVLQYTRTLEEFQKAVGRVRFLDEITEHVLRGYKRYMEDQGYAGKTISTRINIVNFLLKKNHITVRLPKDEMPIVEEETAVPYTEDELEILFQAMTPEEFVRYKFFLGTACRDKEVTFAAWPDIDFAGAKYHVRGKPDLGFTLKNHESRTVPIPKGLVDLLRDRKKHPQHARWIFVNNQGRPDNHFLRKLKSIAKRAGLNCGHCETSLSVGRHDQTKTVKVSCKDHPVCEHFYLHRFRKTRATQWRDAGIPVDTIRQWLGHKNLQTTQIYLGPSHSGRFQDKIDEGF